MFSFSLCVKYKKKMCLVCSFDDKLNETLCIKRITSTYNNYANDYRLYCKFTAIIILPYESLWEYLLYNITILIIPVKMRCYTSSVNRAYFQCVWRSMFCNISIARGNKMTKDKLFVFYFFSFHPPLEFFYSKLYFLCITIRSNEKQIITNELFNFHWISFHQIQSVQHIYHISIRGSWENIRLYSNFFLSSVPVI